jgi:Spy/CpxP family protein refolding chaperone
MWEKAKIILIMLSIGFNIAFSVIWITHFASGRSKKTDQTMAGCPRTGGQTPLYEQLDLSEEQSKKAESRMIAFRSASDTICGDTEILRNELINLIARPYPDAGAISKKQEEIIANQKKMQKLTISHILEMKRIFTPDQRKKFFILMRGQMKCSIPGPMMNPQ